MVLLPSPVYPALMYPSRTPSCSSLRIIVLATLMSIPLSGCAPAEPRPEEVPLTWEETVELLTETVPEVSAFELEVAARSAAAGEVTYGDYETAFENAFQCMEGTGAVIDVDSEVTYAGLPILDWSYTVAESDDPDRVGSLVGTCFDREALLVDGLYKNQPSAVEWIDRYQEGLREEMVGCLERQGLEVDPEAPIADLVTIDFENQVSANSSGLCSTETGILNFFAST